MINKITPLNIYHIIPHIHYESSGPTYSVTNLCVSLSGIGAKLNLLCLNPGKEIDYLHVTSFKNVSLYKNLGRSPAMYSYLRDRMEGENVIFHNHSLWMYPNFYPGWLKKKSLKIKLVVSPRGTLSEYALTVSKWKKKIIWPLQKNTLKYADCFHATGINEYLDIRTQGYKQPVAIIPNGIDIPDLSLKSNFKEQKKIIFLGRLHPIKGIDNLLKVWSKLENSFPNWDMHIIGPDNDGYKEELMNIVSSCNLRRVHFEGEVNGDDKIRWYQNADLFVLPSHSENFGVSIAESLANATPVIVTDKTPWRSVNEKQCGWSIPDDVDELYSAMKKALLSNGLEEMGVRGRMWMQEDYNWKKIAIKMNQLYGWLYGHNVKPQFVKTD